MRSGIASKASLYVTRAIDKVIVELLPASGEGTPSGTGAAVVATGA